MQLTKLILRYIISYANANHSHIDRRIGMFKKITAVIVSLICALPVCACAADNSKATGKISVAVTFNAMKEFTQAVGKDKVDITTIIPDGVEPHDFEPKPKDMVSLAKSDIVVFNGMGMETWVEDAVTSSGNTSIIKVEASKGVEPIKSENAANAQNDPHVWLSLKGAETEVKNIADALIKKDPANADFYKKNSESYIKELEELYNKYNDQFKASDNKDFVTGHAAFAYFCRDFGLEQNSVQDVFAEGEPTAKDMSKLIDFCKAKNVKTIFAEDMVSPDVSKTLANTVGADVKTIYTCESNEENKSYIDRMTENLEKISASMK